MSLEDLKKLIPTVKTEEKNVSGWESLRDSRAKHAPILGKDSGWTVFKYNFASLWFCELQSKAFVWAAFANAIAVMFTAAWDLTPLELWFIWVNAIGSSLHLAAKDQFRQVVTAACNRWGGGKDGVQASASTIVANPSTGEVAIKTEEKHA